MRLIPCALAVSLSLTAIAAGFADGAASASPSASGLCPIIKGPQWKESQVTISGRKTSTLGVKYSVTKSSFFSCAQLAVMLPKIVLAPVGSRPYGLDCAGRRDLRGDLAVGYCLKNGKIAFEFGFAET